MNAVAISVFDPTPVTSIRSIGATEHRTLGLSSNQCQNCGEFNYIMNHYFTIFNVIQINHIVD